MKLWLSMIIFRKGWKQMNSINSYQGNTNYNSQMNGVQGNKTHRHHHKAQSQDGPNPLDDLVKKGTITQDQENAIKSAFDSTKIRNTSSTPTTTQDNPLDSLVKDGELTQDQEDAIKSAFDAARQSHQRDQAKSNPSNHVNPLDQLVKSGTITQDQEDAIKGAFESAMKSKQAISAYQSGSSAPNPLDSLVKAGTITQDQEKSIQDTLNEARKSHHHAHEGSGKAMERSTKILDDLVSNGTISKDQEQSIQGAFESAIKAYQSQSFDASNSQNPNPIISPATTDESK